MKNNTIKHKLDKKTNRPKNAQIGRNPTDCIWTMWPAAPRNTNSFIVVVYRVIYYDLTKGLMSKDVYALPPLNVIQWCNMCPTMLL